MSTAKDEGHVAKHFAALSTNAEKVIMEFLISIEAPLVYERSFLLKDNNDT